MMSVHDALQAWQDGDVTAARAMRLTGAVDVMELHAFAATSGVEMRPGLLPAEERAAERATGLLRRLGHEEAVPEGAGP